MTDPAHPFCRGAKILIDGTHANFHTLEEPGGRAGRYWGVREAAAQRRLRRTTSDGESSHPAAHNRRRRPVIANATTERGPETNAVPRGDVAAIVDWVSGGGALLIIFDHDPLDRIPALLAAFGIERVRTGATPTYTFKRGNGELNGAAAVANGLGPNTAIDEVTTFTGSVFRIASTPPPGAQFEPVLVFGPGSGFDGLLQGVAIRFGAGRVFVAGEAGSLTAQETFGMQRTWDNERYVRNIAWWLTQ